MAEEDPPAELRLPITGSPVVTAEWLNERLRRAGRLRSGTVTSLAPGKGFYSCTALNTPVSVEYSADSQGDAPRKLLLRCWYEGAGPGDREVRFYKEIAPQSLGVPTVPCYDLVYETDSGHWYALLKDISLTHSPGPEPLTTEQRRFLLYGHTDSTKDASEYCRRTYRAIVRAYAALHARWWDDPVISEERHQGGAGGPHCMSGARSTDSIYSVARHWAEELLPSYRREHMDVPSERHWHLCEKAVARWPDLFIRRVSCGDLTLVQGDSHLGNVFLNRDPARDDLYLLDWDAYQRGIGPWDLACLLVVSHAPAIRRCVERRLLEDYHACLLSNGVHDYSFEQCLADYRLSVLGCLFPPIHWQKPEFLKYAVLAFDDWRCAELLD